MCVFDPNSFYWFFSKAPHLTNLSWGFPLAKSQKFHISWVIPFFQVFTVLYFLIILYIWGLFVGLFGLVWFYLQCLQGLWDSLAYHLSYTPNLFWFSYILDRTLLLAQGWPKSMILLPVAIHVAGIKNIYHHAGEMGSCWLFPWAGLKPEPPDLHLPSSWDYRYKPPCVYFLNLGVLIGEIYNTKSKIPRMDAYIYFLSELLDNPSEFPTWEAR
jgi:hypothetical protein